MFLGVLFVQWVRSSMREAEREDRRLDRLERRDAVELLTLNRPRVLNALDHTTLRELGAATAAVAADAGVRALVVTGAGKAFSPGADIAAMAAMSPGEGHAYAQLGHAVMAAVEALAVPVVAAVNGVALGGGPTTR